MNGTSCVTEFDMGSESIVPRKAEYVALLKEYATRVFVQSGSWIVGDAALDQYREQTACMQRRLLRMMDELRQGPPQ